MRVENVADPLHAAIEVRLQLFGELLARRLVRGISLVSMRETGVMHPSEVVGAVRLEEALHEVDDSPRGGRVFAAARRERTRNQGEERAIDERIAVHEEETGRRRRRRGRGHGEMSRCRAMTVRSIVERSRRDAMRSIPACITPNAAPPAWWSAGGARSFRPWRRLRQTRTTLAACRPFSPVRISNSTSCPSSSFSQLAMLMAEKCTKTSSPLSCSMKP